MYVFLLAGCEVTVSAFVIATGNFLCIRREREDGQAKIEMAVSAAELEGLNQAANEELDGGKKEQTGKENGKVRVLKVQEDMTVTEAPEDTGN